MKVSPIYIQLPGQSEGHLCQFSEAIPAAPTEEEKVSPDFLRAASMLRYLPMAVSQFNSSTGKLMHQNPEACSVFGWPTSSNDDTEAGRVDVDEGRKDATDGTRISNCQRPSQSRHHPIASSDLDYSSNMEDQPQHKKAKSLFEVIDDTPTTNEATALRSAVPPTFTSPSIASVIEGQHKGQARKSLDTETTATASTATSASSLYARTTSNGDQSNNSTIKTFPESDDDLSSGYLEVEETKEQEPDSEDEDDPSNHFLSRFVDKKLACCLLNKIRSGQDVSIEALVHTKSGPEWNAIHARLAMDAVSENPVILYTARDITELINAKKEIQLNLERAEFFAIM